MGIFVMKRKLYVVVFSYIVLVQLEPSSQLTRRTELSDNGYGSAQGR